MIHLKLPYLSPSINHVYMHVRAPGSGGMMRVLTPAGRKFKKEATAHLAKNYPQALALMKENKPYTLFMRFTVTDLENKGWVKGSTSRYKRHDVSNRIKVLEDVIVEVTGVDDSHFISVACQKVQGTMEATDIYIWNLTEEGSPFDAAALTI